MVYFIGRPFAFYIEVSKPVGPVQHTVDPDHNIAVVVFMPCCLPCYLSASTYNPTEHPRLRVIVKDCPETFGCQGHFA